MPTMFDAPRPQGMFSPAASRGMFSPAYAAPLYDEVAARQVADQPGFREKLNDWWQNTTFFKPAFDELVGAATLPGDVYSGEQQLYAPNPMTGEVHTDPGLIDRAGAVAGSMTLGAGAVPAEANALRMGIKAFHGSPHDFDKFSMEKIGTGEGAQAYGHGMYFAENEGVARDYQKTLAAKFSSINRSRLAKEAGEVLGISSKYMPDQILKLLEEGTPIDQVALAMMKDPLMRGRSAEDISRAVDYVKAKFPEHAAVKGSMYEVDIAANPEDFLDWDKPLSEQPQKVSEALERLRTHALQDEGTAGSVLKQALEDNPAAGQIISAHQLAYGPEGAQTLRQAGIPGIRYLDQGSRGVAATQGPRIAKMEQDVAHLRNLIASGTDPNVVASNTARLRETEEALEAVKKEANVSRNYVVFDDAILNILRKYGFPMAPLAGGGAVVGAMQPSESQAAPPMPSGGGW